MKLIKSKRFFTEDEVIKFLEALPDYVARSAKVLTITELSAIGNLYVGYFVLYEKTIRKYVFKIGRGR
jgi:hypothetical protein